MNNFYIFSNVQKNEDSKLGFESCLYGGKKNNRFEKGRRMHQINSVDIKKNISSSGE